MTKEEEINDYGFSFGETPEIPFMSEEEIVALRQEVVDLSEEVLRLKKVNRETVKMITKVMNNLKMNPEQPIIKWPNRVEKIDEFLKNINNLDNKNEETSTKPIT